MAFFKYLLICIALVGCSLPKEKKERCLNISFHIQPATLDPRKSGDFISSTLISLIYEGLTRCLADGSVELDPAPIGEGHRESFVK